MPKKDAKAKAVEKKAAKAARQSKKTEKKEKKAKSKSKDDDGSDEDVDLEAVLAEYAKQVNLPTCSYIFISFLSSVLFHLDHVYKSSIIC